MTDQPSAGQGDWEGAIVQLSQGNLDSTMTHFTLALRLTPMLADAYFYRGQARQQGKPWDEARGDLNVAREDYKAAYTDFSQVLQHAPRHVEALVWRGMVLMLASVPDKAITDFTRAIQIDPTHTRALYNRGRLYAAQGNPRGAFEDFSRAIDLDPSSVEAYLQRAKLMFLVGEAERAVTEATSALSLDPDFHSGYLNRGILYKEIGDNRHALADCEEYVRRGGPRSDEARVWISNLKKRRQPYQKSGAPNAPPISFSSLCVVDYGKGSRKYAVPWPSAVQPVWPS